MKPSNTTNPSSNPPMTADCVSKRCRLLAPALILASLIPGEHAGAAPGTSSPCVEKASGQAVVTIDEIRPDESESTTIDYGHGKFNLETGAALFLVQVNHRVNPGPPEAMAAQYLRENAHKLHLADKTLGDLKSSKAKTHPGGHTVRFYQHLDGIPVYNGEIVVTINKHSTITAMVNDYKPNVWLPSTAPTLTAGEAREVALDYLGMEGDLSYDGSRLVVYHLKGRSRLTWKLDLTAEECPPGAWEALVDAHTGKLVKVVNTEVNVTGRGYVYDPDPLSATGASYGDSGYVDGNAPDMPDGFNYGADTFELGAARSQARDLLELWPDANLNYRLRGPWAHIVDVKKPRTGWFTQDGPNYFFTRSEPGFEAVNAYWHIDNFMRYVNLDLGIYIRPYQYPYGGVRYDPHTNEGGAFYHHSFGHIKLGLGTANLPIDRGEDASVIIHELGHGLHDWATCSDQPINCAYQNNCNCGGVSNEDGLSEGVGDYFAASYVRSLGLWQETDPQYHRVFNWSHNAGPNDFRGRVTNYTGDYDANPSSIHQNGQVFSSCFMELWDEIGRELTDTAVLVGLSMSGRNTKQPEAIKLIFQAATDMGYLNEVLLEMEQTTESYYDIDVGTIGSSFAPDLTVTNLTVSDTRLKREQQVTLTANVRNLGNIDSEEAANLHYYISDTNGPIATFSVPVLDPLAGPNDTFVHVFNWTAPDASGPFWLGACVDAVSDESNIANQCSMGIPIVVFDPFACTGEPLIIHDTEFTGIEAQLSELDQAASPFDFRPIESATGFEFNSMGFRKSDGLLYAAMLTDGLTSGNQGIVMIDSTPTLLWAGAPLPLEVRFSAGDISDDGDTLYVTAYNEPLYAVDLTSLPLTATSVAIFGTATGIVHDWAFNPADGKLYGGDQSDGQLAVLETTGHRTDQPLPGLPTGVAYGGAWFDASGMLNLYRNDGSIYTIDPTVPEIVATRAGGPEASRNDIASCPQKLLGVAKQISPDHQSLPATVTIEYVFENLSATEDLFDLTAIDDLEDAFGLFPDDWTFTSISSTPAEFANLGFVGHAGGDTELIAPGEDLPAGETKTVTVEIEVFTDDHSDNGRFCDQVMAFGETLDGRSFGDRSTAGIDPDPNSDGSPEEREPSCTLLGVDEIVCSDSGEAFIVQDEEAQLYRCSSFLPLSCAPMAGLTFDGQPIEVNNLGYRSSDGLLYALQLTPGGNLQLVLIDDDGTVYGLGRPEGLPANERFDAGDVSPDGTTMYFNRSGLTPLFTVDLTSSPLLATEVEVTGSTGIVSDWAVHPDGDKLYGGDSTGANNQGQLAMIDLGTAGSGTVTRSDMALPGLPRGVPFGGAWFGASGHLFLYRNDGRIFEIDVDLPAVLQEVTDGSTTRFDGASCPGSATSAAPCTDNSDCGVGDYCQKADGACASQGICSPLPEVCTFEYDPVCGCDGIVYSNACEAAAAGANVESTGDSC